MGIEKVLIFVFGIIIFLSVTVSTIEIFKPVSKKMDFNAECIKTQRSMDINGGMSVTDSDNLTTKLTSIGFINITIVGTSSAKQGDNITLTVNADYTYSNLTAWLSRVNKTQHMVFDKTTVARMVTNL